MPRKLSPLFIVALIAFVVSCEFQPTDVKFTEVAEPKTDGITLDLVNYEPGDTIKAYQPIRITFDANNPNHPAFDSQVLIDDTEIQSDVGGVYLPGTLATGYYKFTVRLFVDSGSGSLADALGGEFIVVERVYVLYFDRSVPAVPPPLTVEVKDATLFLHWNKSKEFAFQNYEIFKLCQDAVDSMFYLCWSKAITDVNRTSMRDSTFIGGGVKYQLRVTARFQTSEFSNTNFKRKHTVGLTVAKTAKGQATFKWRKPALYANLARYNVWFSSGDEINKTNPNDTTYVMPLTRFGETKTLQLSPLPFVDQYYRNNYYETKTAKIGDDFPGVYRQAIEYIPATNRYYYLSQSYENGYVYTLHVLDGTTHEELASVKYPWLLHAISPDGNRMYAVSSTGLVKLNPQTLEVIGGINFSVLQAQSMGFGNSISVSNNNIVAYRTGTNNFVIDVDNVTILQKRNPVGDLAISSSGKYVMSAGALFEWNGTTYVSKGTYTNTNLYYATFDKTERPVLCFSGNMKLLDVTNASVVRTIPTQGAYYKYDWQSGYFGTYDTEFVSTRKYYVYSPDQTSEITSFLIWPGFSTQYDQMISIANSRIICPGTYVPLSYYTE